MRKRATDGTKISTSPTITKKTVRTRRRAERLFSGTAYPAIMRLPAGPPRQAFHVLAGSVELYLPLAGMLDLGAEREDVEVVPDRVERQVEPPRELPQVEARIALQELEDPVTRCQ